ncbi:MAG: hydroxymethylglutaryl-CoA reductase, degradative [Chlorobi bacterium]|nr:hydroxymethylglutaryl-CoA reductase, degradative [Chlorobiota bacterium]
MHEKFVEGFSKWTKARKIDWLARHYLSPAGAETLRSYWHRDPATQEIHDGFAENPVSNFYLPFSVAPNFLINDKVYAVPMVTEESSVVAAAAKAAKFWFPHGGFRSRVISKIKTGHIHLLYRNDPEKLKAFFEAVKHEYLRRLKPFTENMEKRGGGILSVELEDLTHLLPNYFTVSFRFDTADSMGANFINTILEEWADYMEEDYPAYGSPEDLEIVMRILSNYNPECRVKVTARAPVEKLKVGENPHRYARRLVTAMDMARVNVYRGVTHNKGIMNGVDAVVLATGNDFRAVEAGAHAYAARKGKYTALSSARLEGDSLVLEMELPLALGTVGGVTKTHPLAAAALEMLGNPSAGELMEIAAAVGLAQNFSAVHSLITEGIQKGHMKMHLNNILLQMQATPEERAALTEIFKDRKVHVKAVKDELNRLRKSKNHDNRTA